MKRKPALKEKQARGRENPPFPRTNRSKAPTVNSTESLKKSFIHFSPVAVPEILCSLFARRISTAVTRSPPSPCHRPRSAHSPAICSNTKLVRCKHLSPPSSQFLYRRATVALCTDTKSLVVLLRSRRHSGTLSGKPKYRLVPGSLIGEY